MLLFIKERNKNYTVTLRDIYIYLRIYFYPWIPAPYTYLNKIMPEMFQKHNNILKESDYQKMKKMRHVALIIFHIEWYSYGAFS